MSESLDDARRRDIVEVIEAFGRGVLPLSVPIALLGHDARGTAKWLSAGPDLPRALPAHLALRTHTRRPRLTNTPDDHA
jgi:uncharacterized protein YbgA (DUF1722 family)